MSLAGPVTGGRHGWPFAQAVRDIGALGYVEDEFILAGEATPYVLAEGASFDADGRWRVRATDARPFCTRVLVRRPVDPARFNGCMMVVWTNVTAGFEVIEWESTEARTAMPGRSCRPNMSACTVWARRQPGLSRGTLTVTARCTSTLTISATTFSRRLPRRSVRYDQPSTTHIRLIPCGASM